MNANGPLVARNQMHQEFPWLPDSLLELFEHIGNQKFVVPNLELDRQIHAVCLISRVNNRINSIMFEHVGHCFSHRPACVIEPDLVTSIQSAMLSQEEIAETAQLFSPLLESMTNMEGEGSLVNRRELMPGVYTEEEYFLRKQSDSVVLQ